MDINYHYFAVKALASTAGFQETEAQQIATYSQFVDDFDLYKWILMADVPDYAQHLAYKIPFGWFFNPATSGFNSWFDMAMLTSAKNQKWILMPFHFIPKKRIQELSDRLYWRVEPAQLDTPSLISNMLKEAKTIFINNEDKNKMVSLMRIGALLHIFADTYAHQNFSGSWGWENHSRLETVIDNIHDKDITPSYEPAVYNKLPSIGHTNVNHAPDDSNVTFHMRQKLHEKDSTYSMRYSRSNTREYTLVSKEIFNFLLSCLEKPAADDNQWNSLMKLLTQGFLTPLKDEKKLAVHWKSIFTGVDFHYDKKGILESLLAIDESTPVNISVLEALQSESNEVVFKAKSDMWFWYNVIADKIRVYVNNEKFSDSKWEAYKNDLQSKNLSDED